MMRTTQSRLAIRGAALLAVLAVVAAAGLYVRGRIIEQQNIRYAQSLVQRLLDAKIAEVPSIVAELSDYREWVADELLATLQAADLNSSHRLHASLALLPVDRGQVGFLHDQLLEASPDEFPVIRDFLAERHSLLVDDFWSEVTRKQSAQGHKQLRAACALASFDPDNPRWEERHETYAALWIESESSEDVLYVGVTEANETEQRELLRSSGLDRLTFMVLTGKDGQPQYSGIWRRRWTPGSRYQHCFDGCGRQLGAWLLRGLEPKFVAIVSECGR